MRKNLFEVPGLQTELKTFKKEPFNSLSISQRCLSVNAKNFNLNNGYSWKSQINRLNS